MNDWNDIPLNENCKECGKILPMKKETELWRFIVRRLEAGQETTLLIVAESTGSSPGRQGFKMAVSEDALCGSIGGGVMEMRLVEEAKLRVANYELRITKIVEQIHRKNSSAASGMICSGRQTIIFFEIERSHLETIREIVRALEECEAKVLRISNLKFEISALQTDDFDFRFKRQSDDEFLYEEKLGFKNKLSIVGGGHCALALSELMSKMDFYIELFDDRADLNTIEKNKFAHRKQVVSSYENIGSLVASGARNQFVVVMTLGYKTDEIVVRKLLDKDFKYFGVLGSRAKMRTLFRNLEREGCERERLNKIRAPVGLKINSRTPEEIAVSIAAEIIAVKNAGENKRRG